MTRGRISEGRRWISRLFAGWSGPEEIDDVVVLTSPWEGSGRYTDLAFKGVSGTAATIAGSPVVPDDRQWWVPFCEAYHDDAALTSHLWLTIQDRGANNVTVVGGSDVTANRHISIRRPLIIPEGGRMFANLATVTGAGKKLWIKLYYVETALGEFIPPL